MTDTDDVERQDTLARLAESRAEILRILEPPPQNESPDAAGEQSAAFPRSRTMKLLLTGRGIGTLSALIGGLAIARPALVFRLVRMIPAGAVARMLLVKGIAALRKK